MVCSRGGRECGTFHASTCPVRRFGIGKENTMCIRGFVQGRRDALRAPAGPEAMAVVMIKGYPKPCASRTIESGRHDERRAPVRLCANVERAYREFRNEPADAPWEMQKILDAWYRQARRRRIEVDFR
jgi:hypothetical protein